MLIVSLVWSPISLLYYFTLQPSICILFRDNKTRLTRVTVRLQSFFFQFKEFTPVLFLIQRVHKMPFMKKVSTYSMTIKLHYSSEQYGFFTWNAVVKVWTLNICNIIFEQNAINLRECFRNLSRNDVVDWSAEKSTQHLSIHICSQRSKSVINN